MARFVILLHETPVAHSQPTHWDFMLETGAALRTWALAEEPCSESSITAQALPDHRLAYLDYEGDISGDRGSVTRWDEGTYSSEFQGADRLVVCLLGRRLQCRLTLVQDGDDARQWLARFETGAAG